MGEHDMVGQKRSSDDALRGVQLPTPLDAGPGCGRIGLNLRDCGPVTGGGVFAPLDKENPRYREYESRYGREMARLAAQTLAKRFYLDNDNGIVVSTLASEHYQNGGITFCPTDNAAGFPAMPGVVFKRSIRKSTRRPNEFVYPAWPFNANGVPWPTDYRPPPVSAKPIVSFCGVLRPPIRQLAVAALQQVRNADVRMIQMMHFSEGIDNEGRRELIRSVLGSHGVLCCRGVGNFSYRLYECMSLGRVPLLADTDSVDEGIPSFWLTDRRDVRRIARDIEDLVDCTDFSDEACRKWQSTYNSLYSPAAWPLSIAKHLVDG